MTAALRQILLVEDSPGDARLVQEMLREADAGDHTLIHVTTVQAGVDHLTQPGHITDVVLLDLTLPDETGLETLRRVVDVAGQTSVVVMTGAGDEALGLEAVKAGAQDYLVKGHVDAKGLRRAVMFALERQRKYQEESFEDHLTGLHNRRGFLNLAAQHLRLVRRQRQCFLTLFLDVDNLKQINDTFGHAEGNRALVETADVLRRCFRQSDIVARLGGDEFAALVLDAERSGDVSIETVRNRLDHVLHHLNAQPDREYALVLSCGILRCGPDDAKSIEPLLERADALMYVEKRAKKARRADKQPALKA